MDLVGIKSFDPLWKRSEKFLGSVGGKRAAESDGVDDSGARLRKKVRGDSGGDMKRVAEIVLVLSAIGEIRGGRNPTHVEKVLMEEAREKLVEMCESLAPKDILPADAVRVVVEDLGLNRSSDTRLGFRTPKMSIAEKLLLTKRKMEESREFAAQSARYSSQLSQMSAGGYPRFPPDKSNFTPVPTGGFQSASSLSHVAPLASVSSVTQSPVNEVHSAMVSRGLHSSPLEKDSSSLALPQTGVEHFKLVGRSNGSTYASQLQANPSGDYMLEKAPNFALQSQFAAVATVGQVNKVQDHASIKIEGASDICTPQVVLQPTRDQNSKPSVIQSGFGNQTSIHQPSQDMNIVQTSSLYTNHYDIARKVQKFLQPRLPEHPNWTSPSVDYMNKVVTCQICKATINDVESLLVCDACEKGRHLKCLQSYNQKGVSKVEWHCTKCLISSNGKPLPPKYGRVTRNISTPNVSSNTDGVQASLEKKVESSGQKVNHQKITANGFPGSLNHVHACSAGSNNTELATDLKMSNARETPGANFSASRIKMEDGAYCRTFPDKSKEATGAYYLTPPVIQNEKFNRSIQDNKLSPCDSKSSISGPKSPPKSGPRYSCSEKLSDKGIDVCDHSQGECNSHELEQTRPPICAKVCVNQSHFNIPASKEFETSDLRGISECNPRSDMGRDGQDVALPGSFGTLDVGNGASDCTRSSLDGLHSVDWVGDILQVVGEKAFYRSCQINGVLYKLQDHVLFPSNDDKLAPSKLQALWEDNKSRSKWAIVNRCYLPADLPEVVGQPSTPENNEVYESNSDNTVMAGLIQGPCKVLPPNKFMEESERRNQLWEGANDGLQPVYQCRWFYDEPKGLFRPVTD